MIEFLRKEPDYFGLAYFWSPEIDSSLESGRVSEGPLSQRNGCWEGSRNNRSLHIPIGCTTYIHTLCSMNTFWKITFLMQCRYSDIMQITNVQQKGPLFNRCQSPHSEKKAQGSFPSLVSSDEVHVSSSSVTVLCPCGVLCGVEWYIRIQTHLI